MWQVTDQGIDQAFGSAALQSLTDGPASQAVAASVLFPRLGHMVTDPDPRRLLARIGPMPAGPAVQATTDVRHLPGGGGRAGHRRGGAVMP